MYMALLTHKLILDISNNKPPILFIQAEEPSHGHSKKACCYISKRLEFRYDIFMELAELLIIYILLLVATITLTVIKNTPWFSIIGAALMPICFLFVISIVLQSSDTNQQDWEEEVYKE